MEQPPLYRRFRRYVSVLVGTVLSTLVGLGLAGCASAPAQPARAGYAVRFTATRLKDHTLLALVSVPVRLGQRGDARTGSKVATEEKPALPEFMATLQTTKASGIYQLVTKVAVREVARNKKGKLKRSQRNEGALVPIRLGETQVVSVPEDPIQLEVRVERR